MLGYPARAKRPLGWLWRRLDAARSFVSRLARTIPLPTPNQAFFNGLFAETIFNEDSSCENETS